MDTDKVLYKKKTLMTLGELSAFLERYDLQLPRDHYDKKNEVVVGCTVDLTKEVPRATAITKKHNIFYLPF